MSKKHLHELDTDDLLKQLEDAPESENVEDSFEFDNQVIQFIKKYNIKPGKNYFRSLFLYRLFKLTYPDSMNANKFTAVMSRYFETVQTKNEQKVFLLDKSLFELSAEVDKLIRVVRTKPQKSPTYIKYYENYLKQFSLAPGTTWTCINVLYEMWKEFRKSKYILMSRERFKLFLDKTFKHKTLNNLEYYLTNLPRKSNEENKQKNEE
jgi:hypothetical protein